MGATRSARRALPVSLALLAAGACEVEWGGARLALEDPAPPPDTTRAADPVEEPREPLPDGPLLYLVRLDPAGRARVVAAARLPAATPVALGTPAVIDPRYRAAFDSTFLAPGTELPLLASGRRIGTLVLTGVTRVVDEACSSVADATVLLLPGQPPPRYAFAISDGRPAAAPSIVSALDPSRSMVVASPVLAERLIDDERAFLAQRVGLQAVMLDGDTVPAMTATYLVADSLAPGPPSGDAISLFFIARFEPARGFSSVWQEVRRYSTAENKEAFEYLDWIRTPAGRVDFLRRVDGSAIGLAAGVAPVDGGARGVDWIEGPDCRALALVGDAGPP